MSKLRWAQFFWSDWANDSALNLCSLPAQGLWMRLLCLMAQGEPYGTLTIKGKVPTDAELFRLTCPRGTRLRDFRRWLDELKDHGVATVRPHSDHTATIQSPRMSHDGAISLARMEAAHASWESTDKDRNPRNLHEQKPENYRNLHVQKSVLHTANLSETESESKESPSVGSRIAGTSARANGTNPRAEGTNPRATGTNQRAMGTNPRATGTNPRSQREPTTRIVLDMIRREQEEARHAEACACEARARVAAVARDPHDRDDGTQ